MARPCVQKRTHTCTKRTWCATKTWLSVFLVLVTLQNNHVEAIGNPTVFGEKLKIDGNWSPHPDTTSGFKWKWEEESNVPCLNTEDQTSMHIQPEMAFRVGKRDWLTADIVGRLTSIVMRELVGVNVVYYLYSIISKYYYSE